jgi:hypothetical protein
MCHTETIKLEKKNEGCDIFLYTICIGGIVVPILFLMVFQSRIDADIFPNWNDNSLFCVILMFLVGLIPYFARLLYTQSLSLYKKNDIKKAEKKEIVADLLLWSCGVITIVLMAIIVYNTGGLKHSLMAFYFFFIPSAIAVAFRAKWGLIITCFACVIVIFILYKLDSVPVKPFCKWYNFGFHIYQITIILLLELVTNHRIKKLETK